MGNSEEAPWRRAERTYQDDLYAEETISELFEESVRRHGRRDAQLYKGGVYDRSLSSITAAPDGEYAALTYEDLHGIVRHLAAGFRDLGFGNDDRVAIFADTRMEWAQVDLALLGAGCVVTTVYTQSSPGKVQYLLDDSDVSGVVVENERLLERVRAVEDSLSLSKIVLVDEPTRDHDGVCTLGEVYDRGRETFDPAAYRRWIDDREPSDLASLVYTSGATGMPKGVRLTHWNFRANVHQIRRRLGPGATRDPDTPTIGPETRTISVLPLAHVFERLAGHFLMLGSGATVGYAESPDTVSADIRSIRPTAGISVPRVYERIFDSMREQAGESGFKRRVFEWAISVAREFQQVADPGPWLRIRHALADRLVYSTVRERLGGRIEFLVSGGGSLSVDLCRLFNGMDVTVIEGYGLTEASPVVSVNPPEDIRPGTLGVPLTGVDVRIDESRVDTEQFPDASGTVGELLVRGDNVTDGYWGDPAATEAAFEDDWFRTGDVVELTDDGYLIFQDRLKQLLVLSTGKNVAPARIEQEFATVDRIDQVMVLGDGQKFVAALVVPNFEHLSVWARDNDVSLPTDREELVEDDRVREWVGEAVQAVNGSLEPVEQIKQFELVAREWTAENGLLTPSMKKKRRDIESAHAEKIERIYAEPLATERS